MALGQEELGKRIKEAREAKDFTQPELAEKIGLKHPQSVSRYERGLNEVPPRRLRRIAEVTDKPLSFFLGGDDPAPSVPATNGTGGEAWQRELRDELRRGLRDINTKLDRIEAEQRKAAASSSRSPQ